MERILSLSKKIFSWFMRRSGRTKIVLFVSVLFILGGVFWKFQSDKKENGYIFETVSYGTVREVVSDTGAVYAGGQIHVYSPSRGIVKDVYVQNGDSVGKGQKLVTVESSATEQEKQAAHAQYLTAVSNLATARATEDLLRADMYTKWKTYRDLATNSTYEHDDETPKEDERLNSAEFQSTRDLWEAAERKYAEQQTAISAAGSQVAATRKAYEATQNAVVTAPVAGTIANLSVILGSAVDIETQAGLAALGSTAVQPVCTVGNFDSFEFRVPLGQSDITKVQPGQDARIELDAHRDASFSGSVVRVDAVGTNQQGVVKYMVYIRFEESNSSLRAGMTGDAYITTTERQNVLSVSNTAVKPYQGGRAVRIKENGKKELTYIPVSVGIRGDERTEILSGLSEGQRVISSLTNEEIKRTGMFGF